MSEQRGADDVLARYRQAISPTPSEHARLIAAVAARTSGPPPGAPPSTPRGGVPWLAIVGVAIAVGGVGWWSSREIRAELAIEDRAPAPIAAPAPPSPRAADPIAPASTAAPLVAATQPVVVSSTIEAAPRTPTRRKSGARVEPPQPDRAPPIATPDPSLVDAEVALLRSANAALREGRDAEAAAGFDEHARRFADGALVELREVGRALLRCRASDRDPNDDIAAAFAARFPGSPHRDRIARACRAAEPK